MVGLHHGDLCGLWPASPTDVVNLMLYSIFKKLRREDDELVKTNLMLNGMGGNPMEAKGIVSMELTIGSKSLATTFFVIEVQGNYSVILSCN
jgi:hypothetical protein